MIATYVPPVLTPIPRDLAVKCFLWALPKGLPLKAVALALAQSALETGRWKSCYNNEWGNAKAGPKFEGMYTSRRCNEKIDGVWRWFLPEGECNSRWELIVWADGQARARHDVPPGHPQTRFRAYANAYDGCLEHVALLERRFADAWPALMSGNADAFIHMLKLRGYFTEPEGPYHKAVVSLQKEFIRVIDGHLDVPEEPIDDELVRLLAYSDALMVEQSREDIDEQTRAET